MNRLGAVRIAYALLYLAAAGVNTALALRSPGVVRGLANYAYFPFLRHLISVVPNSVFALALLSFAAYQILLVSLLSSRYYRLAFFGGILFHVPSYPLGLSTC